MLKLEKIHSLRKVGVKFWTAKLNFLCKLAFIFFKNTKPFEFSGQKGSQVNVDEQLNVAE